jgi:NADH:quinone reductase (non-electrogenic)
VPDAGDVSREAGEHHDQQEGAPVRASFPLLDHVSILLGRHVGRPVRAISPRLTGSEAAVLPGTERRVWASLSGGTLDLGPMTLAGPGRYPKSMLPVHVQRSPVAAGQARHRVVIVGGGFGGLRATKELLRLPVEITLIDRTNHHLFQPLLYQVATGVLSPGQIAPALRSLFRRTRNVHVVLGEVEAIDLERRVVRTAASARREVPYDTLIVAAGATHSYFGHESWGEFAPAMKTLEDASELRSRILLAFEMADQEPNPTRRASWLTFAIVGAGPTGVELAGQIALLAHRVLRHEYRQAETRQARIVLLDAVPRVLPAFAPRLSEHARSALEDLGVDVTLASEVVDVDAEGVVVRSAAGHERRIAARTVVWAAGVQASPLGAQLADQCAADVDRAGRLHVEPDLTVPERPEVFAVGDMITLPGVPGTAQPAIQEGKYVAQVIRARLTGEPQPPAFAYHDRGSMAIIGRNQAVAELFGRVMVSGLPALVTWGAIHLAYLVGWGSRIETIARWCWTLLTRNRRERLISMDGVEYPAPAAEHGGVVVKLPIDGHGITSEQSAA